MNGMLGFMEPGWLLGVELELLGGRDWPAQNTENHHFSQQMEDRL